MPTLQAEVLADSPIGFWLLDETSGTSANDEISTNDGSYVNTPTLGVTSLTPDGLGYAVTIAAASSEEITFPNNPLSTNASIEVWFKWSAGTALLRDHTQVAGSGWIAFDSGGTFTVRVPSNVNIATSKTTAQVRDGNTHHLVIAKTGANVTVYLDAVSIGSTSSAGNGASADPWHLGRNGITTQYSDATFDAFALYNAALSSGRVTAHYNATGGGARGLAALGVGT